MRFCVPFPMFPAEHVKALASVAEEAGFHFIAVPDSVFFPETVSAGYPYSSDGSRFWAADTPFVDPTVSMAWMAARTTSVRFVTNVLKTPLRDPLLLAKQIASLAVMADDRIEIGVGLSWIPEEFTWTGTNMRTRGARLDEQIDILRLVCSGNGPEFIEHHGKHYDFGRLMISPSPTTPIKVHVGGHSEPALERAARVGDGWISVQATSQEIIDIAERLAHLRAKHGRTGEFSAFVLPIDAVGPDAYRRLADTIEAHGMEPVFMAVPWYYSGKDPNNLDVRRESLMSFGETVISKI